MPWLIKNRKLTNNICRILFVSFSLFFCSHVFSDTTEEFSIKAAFMIKMLPYIEWPAAEDNNKTHFTICIHHTPTHKKVLADWSKNSLVRGKPVDIIHFEKKPTSVKPCDILYASTNEKLSQYIEPANIKNMLTVSDVDGNAKRGFIINFVKINNRHRFEINYEAAKNQGFVISPRLLKIAKIVSTEASKK